MAELAGGLYLRQPDRLADDGAGTTLCAFHSRQHAGQPFARTGGPEAQASLLRKIHLDGTGGPVGQRHPCRAGLVWRWHGAGQFTGRPLCGPLPGSQHSPGSDLGYRRALAVHDHGPPSNPWSLEHHADWHPGGLGPRLQIRLMDVAGDAQTLAAALNHSAFNMANALGAWCLAGLGWPGLAHHFAAH
uniref:Uncharacterized protein n=1 Tax=Panagrolaimus superbus TaxID=310955 RepID=A0A914YNQ4_9BILA